eukprot:NODE_6642_length_550_cov_9.684631_g6222_i0.p1 GENE.NODE_6642_length_550_cov_9.684631_g6222_i0~~NODE_6642_length_550_cov_9.684631_g6222_i0.p1  ORF type:complete len:138 (-),score=23.25 NODE_6642_length_550_cov_9.684631_g6222_i0:88-501(-)
MADSLMQSLTVTVEGTLFPVLKLQWLAPLLQGKRAICRAAEESVPEPVEGASHQPVRWHCVLEGHSLKCFRAESAESRQLIRSIDLKSTRVVPHEQPPCSIALQNLQPGASCLLLQAQSSEDQERWLTKMFLAKHQH